MIFQDPATSLNPRLRVRELIGEAPRVHGLVARADVRAHVLDLMQRVGLDPALADRFPHALSGGQRQRVGIARALAVRPVLVVCDEPVAALDVSVQAQVINLFADLRRDLGLAYLFISHDLAVVRHLSDRVAVLYLGRLVELAATDSAVRAPEPPLHLRAGRGDRGPPPRTPGVRAGAGRDAVAARPTPRLYVPPPLPACVRPVPGGAAGLARGRAGALVRVPSERAGDGIAKALSDDCFWWKPDVGLLLSRKNARELTGEQIPMRRKAEPINPHYEAQPHYSWPRLRCCARVHPSKPESLEFRGVISSAAATKYR